MEYAHLDNGRDASAKGRCRNGGRVGIKNSRAILTPALVRELRASEERTATLARRYGLSWTQTNRVRRGESWQSVS